jgi:hypothetical protein
MKYRVPDMKASGSYSSVIWGPEFHNLKTERTETKRQGLKKKFLQVY